MNTGDILGYPWDGESRRIAHPFKYPIYIIEYG